MIGLGLPLGGTKGTAAPPAPRVVFSPAPGYPTSAAPGDFAAGLTVTGVSDAGGWSFALTNDAGGRVALDALDDSRLECGATAPLEGVYPIEVIATKTAAPESPVVTATLLTVSLAPPTAAGAIADQVFAVGAPESLDVFADFSGLGVSYALAPTSGALVAGTSLSAAGVLSGAALNVEPARTIVVRGANAGGFADTAFNLETAVETSGPPHNPVHFWDFSDAASVTTDGADGVISVADQIGAQALTGPAGKRPLFLPSLEATGGPGARIRYAGQGSVRLDIPAAVVLNTRAVSVFAVGRIDYTGWADNKLAYVSLLNASGAPKAALIKNASQQINFFDGSNNASFASDSTGASVAWLIGDSATSFVGANLDFSDLGAPAAQFATLGGVVGQLTTTNGQYKHRGDMQAVLIYDRALTLPEKDAVLDFLAGRYATAASGQTDEFLFDGDSITAGQIDSAPQTDDPHWTDYSFPSQLQLLYGANAPVCHNTGNPGAPISANTGAARVLARLAASAASNVRRVFALWGNNDLNAGRTAAQVAADYESYMATIRGAHPDVEVGIGTILNTNRWAAPGPIEDERLAFNDMVRGLTGAMSHDFHIDTQATPELQTPTNTAFFFDGVHLTVAGYGALATTVKSGLDAL